jgi:hypothetical protein
MGKVEAAARRLEDKAGSLTTTSEWAAFEARPKALPAPSPEERQAAELSAGQRDSGFPSRMNLRGILWMRNQAFAFINNQLVSLNDTFENCTVRVIDQDTVVLTDPTGKQRTLSFDEVLSRKYPGYNPP